jgi:hypothetical protein
MTTRRAAPSDKSKEPAQLRVHAEADTTPGLQPTSFNGIVDAILEVSRQRNSLLSQIRIALECGQNDQALALARQLCGLSHEESHRTHSRIN